MKAIKPVRTAIAAALMAVFGHASADVITDWNARTNDVIVEAKLGTPPAVRVMAIVQTAAYEAVKSSGKDASSIDAAVATAHRVTLVKLLPAQQALVDAAYQAALAQIPEGASKAAGIAAGEKAATTVLTQRASDVIASESYRPHTTAGAYVPTAAPAVPQWSQRATWSLKTPSQFRPTPPPALGTEAWARDYNEVKELGGKTSTKRSAEQTEIARFWDYSLPPIYYGVVRSVANQPGRDVARNARLYAAVAQGMDDALISCFDAKYHYNFWRPTTAIRNGDLDNNDATQREAAWSPLIDVPMHPEYPSGHSILASTLGAVVKADIGSERMPVLVTTSPTAKGVTRRWNSIDEFVREVSDARIYGGIHFRSATDAATAMGKSIGELTASRLLASPD